MDFVTCEVTARVKSPDGTPIVGAMVSARLSHVVKYQGIIIPQIVTEKTDKHGEAKLSLFPNELSKRVSTYYEFVIETPSRELEILNVRVPKKTSVYLDEIAKVATESVIAKPPSDSTDFVRPPNQGNLDTVWLVKLEPDGGFRLVPSSIESYIPDNPTQDDYATVSISAFIDMLANAKIRGNLLVQRETQLNGNLYLGDITKTDDTTVTIYRGSKSDPKKWGALEMGVYEDGDYAIYGYFNSNGEFLGLYINQDGAHIKRGNGVIEPLLTPPTIPKMIVNSASFVAISNDLTKNIKDNWQTLTVPDTPIVLHVNEEEDTGETGHHLTLDMAKSEYTAKADMVITVSARAVLRCMVDSTSSTCEWGMFAERYDVAKQAWEAIPDSHVIEPVRLVAVELEDSQTFFTIKLKTNDKLRFKHYINDPSFLVSVEASPAMNGLPARSGFLININGELL